MTASDDDLLLMPWAKHSPNGGAHPLICHLIDTMEVAVWPVPEER
ncbi:hypothetical protein [Nocardiopsis chromatogenes]|nr:hypothetical protein [Nocardiopsis chromatogenes]